MTRIAPEALWIGHAGDARAFRELFAAGVRAVVELAHEEAPVAGPRELIWQRFPLLDGGGNPPETPRLAVGAVAALVRARVPVLVSCGAGMSGPPAVAAAALAGRGDFESALRRVTQHRPADVSPALLADVRAALGM